MIFLLPLHVSPSQVRATSQFNRSRWTEPILINVSSLIPAPDKMTDDNFNVTNFKYQ